MNTASQVIAFLIVWFAIGALGAAIWHWYTLGRLDRDWFYLSRKDVINSVHKGYLLAVAVMGPAGFLGVLMAVAISG